MDNLENLNFWVNLWFSLELPTRPSNSSFTHLINAIKKFNKCKSKKRLCNLNKLFNIEIKKDTLTIISLHKV